MRRNNNTKLILANWKATKTRTDVVEWWDTFSRATFAAHAAKPIEVVICPPSPYLFTLFDVFKPNQFPFPVSLGAQDLSRYPGGRYTGEVTAATLRGIATHALLGHSERRRWLGETSQIVAEKARRAMEQTIVPVVLFSRENYREQLTQFDDEELRQMVLVYEPPEAISQLSGTIGEGRPAALDDIKDMVKSLKVLAPESEITYGGSVKSANAKMFLNHPGLAGVIVGTASMDAREFINIINQA